MKNRLIMDVGMHVGRDTQFYLEKGFNVLAIEANPNLAAKAEDKFGGYLDEGRLTICNVAIAEYAGEIDFYVNDRKDEWSTISREFASRNEGLGASNSLIKVKSETFENILDKYGIPYYLKIDIEGADTLCLKALGDYVEKPKYISIEAGLNSFEETFSELSLLWNLGYRNFKIVNQALNKHARCPKPPLEGVFVDYKFDNSCSGPFGEESPGKWMGIEETFVRYRGLLRQQRIFGAGRSPLSGILVRKMYELLKGSPVGWYDFHAKI